MANRIAIYCKQSGGPPIPLTVRIEWMPDGRIIPLMYWTPDGVCYKVTSHSGCVPLAFLKERGEGLRFEVRVEAIETPEPGCDLLHTKHETYLYLADNLFCQKNIIDKRYEHAGKEYISVTLDIFPDCDYELIYFSVHEERYMVEKTSRIEPRGSFRAGGVGLCHWVEARLVNQDDDENPDEHMSVRRPAAIYLELNKWFVFAAKSA